MADLKISKTPEYYQKLKELDTSFAKVAQRTKNVPVMTAIRDKKTLIKLFDQPLQNRPTIQELSSTFENKNGFYKRFLLYMANLPTYNTMVVPISMNDANTLRDGYTKVNEKITRLNIKSNMPMFAYSMLKNGVGYFYEVEDKVELSFKELPAQHCRVSYVEEGVYRVEINIRKIQKADFEFYPKELTLRQDEIDSEGWLQLSNKAFALPFNSNPLSIPVFASLFPNLYDVECNKSTNYEDIKEDKTKLIHCPIPMDEDGELNVDLDTVKIFLGMLKENLPSNIKAVATPFKVDALKVQESSESKEKSVAETLTTGAFNEAGISELLFNNKDNSEGLKMSIKKDEILIYNSVIPVIDSYINFKLKEVDNRFNCKILRSSYFSQSEDIKNALNVMNLGGSRTYAMALLGFNSMEAENLLLLEQHILNVNDLFVPPASAWNTSQKEKEESNNQETGRPPGEEEDKE